MICNIKEVWLFSKITPGLYRICPDYKIAAWIVEVEKETEERQDEIVDDLRSLLRKKEWT